MSGYIYLIHLEQDNNVYKVGRTKNMKRRMNDYKHMRKGDVEIIRCIYLDDIVNNERKLHRLLRNYFHYEGMNNGNKTEWYIADKEDIINKFDDFFNLSINE